MSSGFFSKDNVRRNVYDHIDLLKYQDHIQYIEPNVEEEAITENMKREMRSRDKFSKIINDWTDGPIVDRYGVVKYNGNHNNYIKIRSVLHKMYKEIIQTISDCEFELIDEKQFREEFIYFMYLLSDISR
jgi:hypothetical protein